MYFFFRWRYSPLWVFACQTIPLHFSLSFTNSLHLLTPSTWRSLSTFYLTLHTVLQELEDSLQLPKLYLVLFRPLSLNVSSLFLCSTFVTICFLLCGVVSPTPNPQPGGPEYHFLSGSSPLTYLAWEALTVAYVTASIALRIMWPHKPHHCVKVGTRSGEKVYIYI